MARKETIYTVSTETNTILRASRTFLAALEFAANLTSNSYYLCTSEFQDLKKGDTMSNIADFL
jgi:type II secretory pathway component PulF